MNVERTVGNWWQSGGPPCSPAAPHPRCREHLLGPVQNEGKGKTQLEIQDRRRHSFKSGTADESFCGQVAGVYGEIGVNGDVDSEAGIVTTARYLCVAREL